VIFNRTEDWTHLIESLHGVLKAYLPWRYFALHGSFAHELPKQVVRNHVVSNFIANAMWFFASQVFHLHNQSQVTAFAYTLAESRIAIASAKHEAIRYLEMQATKNSPLPLRAIAMRDANESNIKMASMPRK
jgi:hypothetical protein